MKQKFIVIFGYSGHAFVVLDACKKSGISLTGYCDKIENVTNNVYDLQYLGNETAEQFDWNLFDDCVLGIGDNRIRSKVALMLQEHHKKVLTVIHPSAVINDFVSIGNGTLVASNATINPLASIGEICIINTGSIIEHECKIGNAVHIAPGAVLAGNVTVGHNSFIGANSVVRQGISIGDNVTVGAGSIVVKNIPEGEIWAGNPAKKIK